MNNSAEKIKVAAYGTLRKGNGNHRLLSNATFLGTGKTLDARFTMRGPKFGGFPKVYEEGDKQIVVEVYEVTPEELRRVDDLEGHPNWYERKVVSTDLGDAWMYIMPSKHVYETEIIESGDWNDR